MRILYVLLIAVLNVLGLKAQNTGFVYIESEDAQPFYIRSRDSLYLSAPEGYIILAPLKNLKGELILGFPGKAAAAFVFTISSPEVDKGWLLRDMKKEGWRLYDIRKDELVPIRRLGSGSNPFQGMHKRNDAFAYRLSQVVNDSAVLYYNPPPKPVIPAVRLVSRLETEDAWILLFEVQEARGVDRVEIEIPKNKERKE